eukprot:m.123136 g.123136  ORF g.123136 m.123136 type:complete len:68 (+) comp23374_c1_seq3:47-250(+)
MTNRNFSTVHRFIARQLFGVFPLSGFKPSVIHRVSLFLPTLLSLSIRFMSSGDPGETDSKGTLHGGL